MGKQKKQKNQKDKEDQNLQKTKNIEKINQATKQKRQQNIQQSQEHNQNIPINGPIQIPQDSPQELNPSNHSPQVEEQQQFASINQQDMDTELQQQMKKAIIKHLQQLDDSEDILASVQIPGQNRENLYEFYIKHRFPQQHKSIHEFSQTIQGKQKKLEVKYIDDILCFFLTKGISGKYWDQIEKVYDYLHDKTKISKTILKQYFKQEIDSFPIRHIESIFMTTHSIGSKNASRNNIPLIDFVQTIRKRNKQSRIIVKVDEIKENPKNILNWSQFKDKWMLFEPRSMINQTNRQQRSRELQQFLDGANLYPQRTIVMQKLVEDESKYSSYHPKIWLIKYSKTTGNEKKQKMRMVISTFNLQKAGWQHGTNMFWAKDFIYSEANYQVHQKLIQQPILSPPRESQFHFSKYFLDTLNQLFHKQQVIGLFSMLKMDLGLIRFANLNCVPVITMPQAHFFQSGVLPLSQYTFRQLYQSLNGSWPSGLKAQTHHIASTFKEFDDKVLQYICGKFVPATSDTSDNTIQGIKIYYPNYKFIHDSIKREWNFMDKTEQQPPRSPNFLKKSLLQMISSMYISPPVNALDNFFQYNNQIGEQQNQNIQIQQASDFIRKAKFYNIKNTENKNHRINNQRNPIKTDYSIPHLKAQCLFFRENDNIKHGKNMFLMGSHNMSRASYAENGQLFSDEREGHIIGNIELSLLFFDVPGLYQHLLPLELIPQDVAQHNKYQYSDLFRDCFQHNQFKYSALLTANQIVNQARPYYLINSIDSRSNPKINFDTQIYRLLNENENGFNNPTRFQIKKNFLRLIQKHQQQVQPNKKILLFYPITLQSYNQLSQSTYLKKICQQQQYHEKYRSHVEQIGKLRQDNQRRIMFSYNDQSPDYQFCLKNGMTVLYIADLVVINIQAQGQQIVEELWHYYQSNESWDNFYNFCQKFRFNNAFYIQNRQMVEQRIQSDRNIDLRAIQEVNRLQ